MKTDFFITRKIAKIAGIPLKRAYPTSYVAGVSIPSLSMKILFVNIAVLLFRYALLRKPPSCGAGIAGKRPLHWTSSGLWGLMMAPCGSFTTLLSSRGWKILKWK
jgi:hypothetical protein